MTALRKILFWLHLIAGVLGGIVIFIMCVTGAALSFEKNIIEYSERDQRIVAVGEKRLSAQEMLERVIVHKPDAKPSSFLVSSDPASAVTVALGREGQVFVDPFTGAVTGSGNSAVRSFFRFNTDLHRWIAMSGDGRPIGKAITGATNLMFLFLAISGIYIWFPRNLTWAAMKPNMWFRKTSTGRARDFNWHNTIGWWTSLVLIVLTLTAAVISYQWAGNLVYTLTGNEVPKQQSQGQQAQPTDFVIPANINAIWQLAESQSPGWKSISLRLSLTKDATFTIDEGKSWNIFGRSTLILDAETATVSKWEPYAERNSAQQIRSWMRFTHTGESYGFIGQLIGFIACIGGAVLVYTGFALAVRRLFAWRRRRTLETIS